MSKESLCELRLASGSWIVVACNGFDGSMILLVSTLNTASKGLHVALDDRYDDAEQLDGLQWAAASAAGIYDAVPVSSSMLTRHASCLAGLPTVFEIPPAAHFSGDNVAVYEWMLTELVPNASSTLIVGACHSWANYSCGWGDPLGTAAIDFAVSKRAMVVNLSPERAVNPRQAAAFSNIVAKMDQGFTFSGWAEPESDMVALLSAGGGVVLCGAPNLSFLSSMQVCLVLSNPP